MTQLLRRALRRAHRMLRPALYTSVQDVTVANNRAAYEQVYATEALRTAYLDPGRLEFFDIVARVVASMSPTSVVDVGCGTGSLLAAIRRSVGPECVLAGVDFAASGIAVARELVPEADLRAQSFAEYAPGRDFDVVVCTEVLEHLEDSAGLLSLLQSLKAEGGRIVVTVPDGEIDDFPGHVHFWSESELREFLDSYGLLEIHRIQNVTLLAVLA